MADARVDKLLCDQGLAASRAKAQILIEAGAVRYASAGAWLAITKASQKVPLDSQFKIEPVHELQYVSRAGLKLEAALNWLLAHGHINDQQLKQWVALDVGQSTGGFTDCLLQYGVNQVVGIDVGHAQLDNSLQHHPAVSCLEGVNAKELPVERLLALTPDGFDCIVMDVSFISQTKILPNLPAFAKPGCWLVSLIKPQFEVGREAVGKNGIVKNINAINQAIQSVEACAKANGFAGKAKLESPILGGDGNRETLLVAQRL